MTCEAELLCSVTRMVYSILSLIGSDHQRVSHNRGKAICQAFPHSLVTCFRDEGLVFRGEQIGSMQNLCVPVQDSWNDGIAEQAQITRHNYDIYMP